MVEYLDWIIRGLVGAGFIGLTLWAVKGWLTEKTKMHKGSEQPVTFGELQVHCVKEHQKLDTLLSEKLKTVEKVTKVNLAHGAKKFKAIEDEQKEQRKILDEMRRTLAVWAQKNGLKNET